jgi:hypothetical protein
MKSKRGRRARAHPGLVLSKRGFGVRRLGARTCLRGMGDGVRARQWAAELGAHWLEGAVHGTGGK